MLGIFIILLLTILQAKLQQYMNQELPDVQAGFRKGRGTRDQIANICRIIEKAREFQKNIYLCFIDCTKAFLWVTTNSGKFFKRWEYQTTLPASWETHMQVKKQCNWTWNNKLVQNWERSTSSYILSPCLFNLNAEYFLQNARLHESQDCWEKYQQPQICRGYHFNGRQQRGTKEPLDEDERGERKSWLKTQHSKKNLNMQKTKPVPSLHGK